MKKIIFLSLIVFCFNVAKAQYGYNFAPFGVELGASSVRAYGNLPKNFNNIAFSLSGIYNYSPYLPVAAELQIGTLSGGSNSDKTIDPYGRQYTNNYKAIIIHADLEAGEIMDYGDSFVLNILKNFYVGTGFGVLSNTMGFIQRNDPYNKGYVFPGTNSSINGVLPLRFGYEIKFFNDYEEPSFALNIGYRHNIVFGEGMDGYDDPSARFKNNALDQFRQISISLKFNFGNVTAYNKNIRRF